MMKKRKIAIVALSAVMAASVGVMLAGCNNGGGRTPGSSTVQTTNYNVTFNSNEGSAVAGATVSANSTLAAPEAPTKANAVFGGWYDNENFEGAAVIFPVRVTGNVTYYAKWNAVENEESTIYFAGYGENMPAPLTVAAGSTVDLAGIENPTRNNLALYGWETDDGTLVTDSFVAEGETMYLTSVWARYVYTFNVTGWDECGVEYVDGKIRNDADDFTITLPTVTADDYDAEKFDFDGYFVGNRRIGGEVDAEEAETYNPATLNTEIEVRFTPKYSVTLNYNYAGSTVSTTSERADGMDMEMPVREGYRFLGWSAAAAMGEEEGYIVERTATSYRPTADITLYAQWAEAWTILFNYNYGDTPSVVTEMVEKGETLTAPTPTRAGSFVFGGWYTSATEFTEENRLNAETAPTADATYYARWQLRITVSFNTNTSTWSGVTATVNAVSDGDGLTIAQVLEQYTGTTALNPPTRNNYVFMYWASARSNGRDLTNEVLTANTTVYAIWGVARTVTINLNGDGATMTDSEGASVATTYTVASGTAFDTSVLPAPVREGYTFTGWYTNQAATTAYTGGNITANTTLYAGWAATEEVET